MGGLFNFIKGQLIDVIEWVDDSRDTLSIRFAEASNHEIKNGAQLIVRESQFAQFIHEGQYGDTFGPGHYTLTTNNIPVLTSLKSWKYGFNSPFKVDVYYVTSRLFTGNRWGTANPIMMRDSDFGIVRARAYGTYDFRVKDPKIFLREVAGTDEIFRLEEFGDTMRSRIVSIFSEALAEAKVPVLDVATRYSELGEALLPIINPFVENKYGLSITAFIVENISLPPEVEQAIDKRSSMAAVGNLNDFVKFQMGQGLQMGGGGVAGAAAEAAIGLGIARDLVQTSQQTPPPLPTPPVPGGHPAPPPAVPASPAPAASAAPELLSPAQAAEVLGVTEADVLASLQAGDLKGKKIGSVYRIPRKAIDEFLNS
jgi:excisionase family DNA binding protein